MLSIKEIRKLTDLSQSAFGQMYNIPLRSIQNWESGSRECPIYVKQLLERAVKQDFNIE